MARERERELEPAQGTKIERERELESLPEQGSREPEPAEEPAGPDQTLPSPTSGQGQALSDTQSDVQSPPPPKERTATSYINVICCFVYKTFAGIIKSNIKRMITKFFVLGNFSKYKIYSKVSRCCSKGFRLW